MSNSLATIRVQDGLPLVFEKEGKPLTTSLKVAEYFEKRHADVLRDIEALDCSPEFTQRNFALSYYKDESGKKNKMMFMTFDGFIFLVMGYRGKKAARLKESYINAFNSMAAFIRQIDTARLEFKDFSEAIKQAHPDDLHSYHFSNEFDLINRIVLGMPTRKFKQQHNITANSIRPFLTPAQLDGIIKLQRFDMGLVVTIPNYDDRKRILTDYFNRITALKAVSA